MGPGDTLSLVPVTNLIGMGFTVPHGTVRLVPVVVVVNYGSISFIIQGISMKLGRYIGIGILEFPY